ncbi:hypothetical protein Tco_0882506 [Tanacetum coccineum]
MARLAHPSAVYQSPAMTYPPTTYQSAPVFDPKTNPSPPYQYASTTHYSQSYQSSPTTHSTLRGKNKCFWEESETELLLDVLQDMENDPPWKTDNGFRSNYLGEVHRWILAKRSDLSKIVSFTSYRVKGHMVEDKVSCHQRHVEIFPAHKEKIDLFESA